MFVAIVEILKSEVPCPPECPYRETCEGYNEGESDECEEEPE